MENCRATENDSAMGSYPACVRIATASYRGTVTPVDVVLSPWFGVTGKRPRHGSMDRRINSSMGRLDRSVNRCVDVAWSARQR